MDHTPEHLPSLDAPPNYALHASSSGYLVKYALGGASNVAPGTAVYHVVLHDENHAETSVATKEKYVVTRMKQSGTIAQMDAKDQKKKSHDAEDDVEAPFLVTLLDAKTNEPIFRADAPTAFDLWENTAKVGVDGGHIALHYADLHSPPPHPFHSIAFKIDKQHARFVMTLPPTSPSSVADSGIVSEHFHVEPAMEDELKRGQVYWQVVKPHTSPEQAKAEKEAGYKAVKNEWFWMVLKAVPNDAKSEEDILAYAKIRTTHTQEIFVDLFDPPLVQEAQDLRKKSKESHLNLQGGRAHRIQEHVVVASAWMFGDIVRQRVIALGAVPHESGKCLLL